MSGITSFSGSVAVNPDASVASGYAFIAYALTADIRLNVGTLVNGGFAGLEGQAVTGGTSGATAVLAQFENVAGIVFVALDQVVGTFQSGETLAIGGLTRGTTTSAPLALTDARRAKGAGPCILYFAGNPNGVQEAPLGSLSLDTAGATGPFRNTDGGTAWVTVV